MKNAVDAVKKLPSVGEVLKDPVGALTQDVSISASFGVSRSRSSSNESDQSVVQSLVSGTDVAIIARGAGENGSITVTGSDILADRNLALLANGLIKLQAATETDTSSGKSSSFGVSIGVSAGIGLSAPGKDGTGGGKLGFQAPSVNFGVCGSKSSFTCTDIPNRETNVTAGGTATIGTPGALTLDGAILSPNRGVDDIMLAVVDGLKGFPEAITAVFPDATIQTCIVHLLRNSMDL